MMMVLIKFKFVFCLTLFFSSVKSHDEWKSSLEYYLRASPSLQKDDKIRWNELGYVGGAIVEIWTYRDCSMKEGIDPDHCVKCWLEAAENVTDMINCTAQYMPENYMKCWDIQKWENISQSDKDLVILNCFKETTLDLEFNQCLESICGLNDTCLDRSSMKLVKSCMKDKKQEFKAKIYGEMLNRLFGGQCGKTALALMNMIPMPFEQISGSKMMMMHQTDALVKDLVDALYRSSSAELHQRRPKYFDEDHSSEESEERD